MPQQRPQLELQDVNGFETAAAEIRRASAENEWKILAAELAHPPEVLSVGVFQQGFIGVGLSHQRAEAGPLGNQLLAGHAEHLFKGEDRESSNNRRVHKLEASARSRMLKKLN